MAGEQNAQNIPAEEIIAGYQNELAASHHKNIVLEAHLRRLQRELNEALEDNKRLREQQPVSAERTTSASASDQEATDE